jgi:hypothetical protein
MAEKEQQEQENTGEHLETTGESTPREDVVTIGEELG